MPPADDSDEEWQRIADAVAEFEADYTATRHTPNLDTRHINWHPSDVDPYSRALRDKDNAIRQLHLEQEGQLSNYRHKIRALQNELMAVRAAPRPNPPPSHLHIERNLAQAVQEKERIARELAAIQHDAHHTKEKLMYAEQELLTARDRERAHIAALTKRPPVIPKDVVPATQLQNSSSLSNSNDVVDPTQRFEITRTAIRPPNRRKRRSISDDDSNSSQPLPSTPPVPQHQHGWATDLHPNWQNDALRAKLFGGDTGHQFLQLSSGTGCEPLRSAISHAMASDTWTTLLRPLISLCSAGRAPTLVALRCLEALVTFSEECRKAADAIVMDIVEILQACGERRDFEMAGSCCRILQSVDCVRYIRRCDILRWSFGTVDDVVFRRARLSALELLEDTTCRILEESLESGGTSDEERELDWEFTEKVYSSMASRVNNGAWSGRELGIAVSMLGRAACLSPYMLVDTGGVQGLANAFIYGLHSVRMKMLGERERLETLCELIEGVGVGEKDSGGENPWEADLGDVGVQEGVSVIWTCVRGLLQVGVRLGEVEVSDGTRCVLLEGLAVIGWPRGCEMSWETATPRVLVNDGIGQVCRRVFGIVKRGK